VNYENPESKNMALLEPWKLQNIVYWQLTPPLTAWQSNALKELPTAKKLRNR